ncbi:MAG: hypothetical protein LBO09_06110 [Candidatus Peribacteria bacterium]|jgi:hypothetical protein|nr:hypothetical protein [Candidatus Peribacteria bacterium]
MEPITTPLPQITVPETKTKSPEELSAEMKALSDKIIADEIAKKKSEEGNTTQSTIGLTMTTECMKGVGCKMDVAKMLGLKAQTPTDDRTSVLTFVQDLVLAATFFIGTIVTLAFIRS